MDYAVRVTDESGNDMWLRHGAKIGEGRIVRFRTRRDAEMAIETLAPGLDSGCHADVVRYPQDTLTRKAL